MNAASVTGPDCPVCGVGQMNQINEIDQLRRRMSGWRCEAWAGSVGLIG
jgi:hypothetical protein